MHVHPHDSIEHLQRLRRRKTYQAIAIRLQIIILARQGRTAPQIVQAVGLSRRPVQDWVRRYNGQGIDGLYDRARTGQPKKLPADREPALRQRLLAGPIDADAGVCTLRGEDVQRILLDEFGVAHSLSGVYKLLHRLGLWCLKPRPRHRLCAEHVHAGLKRFDGDWRVRLRGGDDGGEVEPGRAKHIGSVRVRLDSLGVAAQIRRALRVSRGVRLGGLLLEAGLQRGLRAAQTRLIPVAQCHDLGFSHVPIGVQVSGPSAPSIENRTCSNDSDSYTIHVENLLAISLVVR